MDHRFDGAGAGHLSITGASGFVWLIFWLLLYRQPEEHPRVSKAELAYIRSDPQVPTGENQMGAPHSPSSDLGLRGGQVHDRSDLVVLSVLDTGFSGTQTRVVADEDSVCPSW